jgi:CMP-N-acetylneuraminic acid synthetase
VIVVVPARGGSKRVPLKNIADLCGTPLLVYTLLAAEAAGVAPDLYVSTEDDRIANVARGAGAKVIVRPQELASDTASTESALLHVLDTLGVDSMTGEWIMTLPPTSPLRSADTIRAFMALSRDAPEDVDCLMSVTENKSDLWTLQADGSYGRVFPDQPRRQQDRPAVFEENSAVYVTRISALRRTGSILGGSTLCVPIAREEGLDVNTGGDLALAAALVAAGLVTLPPPSRS